MSMQDYEEVYQIIEDSGDSDFEGEKSFELIEAAENILSLKFPPTYRRFLAELGCGDIGGEEIYGIIDNNFMSSSVPNGIWLTLDERKINNLPSNFILIYTNGSGQYYALDTSLFDEDKENPVIRLTADNLVEELIAPSFGSFLKEIVEEVV